MTVTGNYADNPNLGSGVTVGGGVLSTGALSISNSIVAGNFSGSVPQRVRDDVRGDITASNGHNLFGSPVAGEVAGDRENVAVASLFAALDPDTGGGRLALNGGATPTVALRNADGNPALSGGEPVVAGGFDQRLVARPGPAGTNPDIGAFELAQGVVSRSPTAGNDVLTGSAAADRLNGLAGADLLIGLGGGDRVSGGAGGGEGQPRRGHGFGRARRRHADGHREPGGRLRPRPPHRRRPRQRAWRPDGRRPAVRPRGRRPPRRGCGRRPP